jgi:phage baseplate assembly protein W|tara:strand:- start:1826 stop:2227 length:402 start_codon:yes stop_codon:yes gene_type:complete
MPLERVSQGFKDLSASFQSNPLNSDLIAIKNETAISRSIRNIVFTLPGEKFFNEDFGSNVSRSLFENIDSISANLIEDEIKVSINRFEPRVRLIDVETKANFDDYAYNVKIIYEIVGIDVPAQELQFVLQPTR